MQFPNPSSLPVISEEKSCRRIKFSLQDDKKNEKWMWTRKKTRGEEKTRRERGKKKRKIFQYKRNNYRRSWYGDGKRMVQMKPPKFQHPLRPPPTLLLLLRLLFASLSPSLPLYPRPGFLDTRGSLSPRRIQFCSFSSRSFSSLCRRADALAISRQSGVAASVAAYPWNTRCKCRGGDDAKSARANGLGWCTGGVRWATIGRGPSRGVRREGCPPPSPLAAWGNAKVCPGV